MTTTFMTTHMDTPLIRTAAAVLPLLVQAHDRLYPVAAPQASRIAERIATALAELIDIAGDVESYGNKWCGGDMAELATTIRAVTAEYHQA